MEVIHGENDAREHFQAQAQVWSYTYNYMKSLSLKRAIQLRIPDIINNSGQPMTLSQIIAEHWMSIQTKLVALKSLCAFLLTQASLFNKQLAKTTKKKSTICKTLSTRNIQIKLMRNTKVEAYLNSWWFVVVLECRRWTSNLLFSLEFRILSERIREIAEDDERFGTITPF